MVTLWRRLLRARPRRVENRVAEELTKWSAKRGDHWVFERRPAMGRTGPDIEPNPYNFVIDVKSRQSISNKPFEIVKRDPAVKWYIRGENTNWYLCRLDNLDSMFNMDWNTDWWYSVTIESWLNHMQNWADIHGGTGMLVLHKPRKPIGHSIVLIDVGRYLNLTEAMGLL